MQSRLSGIFLSPFDTIEVLLANTAGEAKEVVKTFHAACGSDDAAALRNIWNELKRRYGESSKVAGRIMED